MEYNKLVAVTGLSGLFELVSSKSDGGVVRSLEDKTSKFVSNRVHNFSHIESIEVYTTGENKNLADVFLAMKASAEKMPESNADATAIRAYFEKVVPDMDFKRVYGSDMKKMIKWLELITKNDIEIKLSETPTEDAIAESGNTKKTNAPVTSKAPTVKNAPAKKVNAPRKMV